MVLNNSIPEIAFLIVNNDFLVNPKENYLCTVKRNLNVKERKI